MPGRGRRRGTRAGPPPGAGPGWPPPGTPAAAARGSYPGRELPGPGPLHREANEQVLARQRAALEQQLRGAHQALVAAGSPGAARVPGTAGLGRLQQCGWPVRNPSGQTGLYLLCSGELLQARGRELRSPEDFARAAFRTRSLSAALAGSGQQWMQADRLDDEPAEFRFWAQDIVTRWAGVLGGLLAAHGCTARPGSP